MLSRIGGETFSAINLNLDRFLQATVTEVGKMMEVDRCDVMTLTGGELRITHEYRADLGPDELPSSLEPASAYRYRPPAREH